MTANDRARALGEQIQRELIELADLMQPGESDVDALHQAVTIAYLGQAAARTREIANRLARHIRAREARTPQLDPAAAGEVIRSLEAAATQAGLLAAQLEAAAIAGIPPQAGE